MARLVDTSIVNPGSFDLVPDIAPAANLMLQAFQQRQQNQREDQKFQQLQQAKKIKDASKVAGDQMMRVRGIGDFNTQRKEMAILAQNAIHRDENPEIYSDALNITNPDELNLYLTRMATAMGNAVNAIGESGMASAKTEILGTGATIQALPDKSVEVRDRLGNVVTGEERLRVLDEAAAAKEKKLRTESSIAIETSQKIAGAKGREQRNSAVRKEMSESRRLAARSDIKLRQAETLIGRSDQGLAGAGKVQLARLFPGIDVTDEGALSSSLRVLALDELQKFKGPTTDFEFGVTESIVGALSDPKTANMARIKSLQRNNYFVKKEAEQFARFVKSGGDADDFTFNFAEPISTKKGVFTLQQLQDTAVNSNLSIEDVLKRLNK